MNFQKMMNPTGIPFIISNHFPAQLIKQFHGVLQKLYFFYYKAFPAIWDIKINPQSKKGQSSRVYTKLPPHKKETPKGLFFHFKIIL